MADAPILDGSKTKSRHDIVDEAAHAAADACRALEMAGNEFLNLDIEPNSEIWANTAAKVAGAVVSNYYTPPSPTIAA